MRTDNPLDNIKDFYEKESMSFDQKRTWNEIEARLDKKKRFPVFWLFLGLGIFLIGGSVLVFNQLDGRNKTNSNFEHTAEMHNSPSDKDLVKSTDLSSTTISELPDEIASNEKEAMNKDQLGQTSNTSDEINSSQKKRSQKSKQTLTPTENINPQNKSNTSFDHSTKPAETSEKNKQSTVLAVENTSALSTTVNKNSNKYSLSNQSEQGLSIQSLFEDSEAVAYLDLTALDYTKIKLPEWTIKDRKDICKIPKPWHLMVEGYGGLNLPLMSTKLKKANDNDQLYLDEWKEIQSRNLGYQFGVSFIVFSPSGFEFSFGAERQLFSERLTSTKRVVETTKVYDPMAYFYYDAMNNKIWVGDTITTTKVVERKEDLVQKHRLWNIPLKVGYMKQIKRWNLGVHVGAIIHMDHIFEGRILQQNGSYIDVSAANQEILYKKDVGVSITTDFHFGQQINDRVELFVRPEFRYRMDPWTSDKTVLDIFVNDVKLNTGIRFTIR